METCTALLGTMLAGANEKSEMQVSLLLHPASRFTSHRALRSHPRWKLAWNPLLFIC